MTPHIEQKSQELAHALIRVAGYIRRKELGKRIERLSYELIEQIAAKNAAKAINAASTLKAFIALGRNIIAIEPMNARILLREIDSISNEINKFSGLAQLPDLEALFSKEVKIEKSGNPEAKQLSKPIAEIKDSESSVLRQDKILEKIRQSSEGKVQLRDLIAEFPGISERTIRYDLKKLTLDGKIERQGTGGPSNYYVLKQTSNPGVINL